MFFFPFLCSGIPDLTLGILKMLIRDVTSSLLICPWHDVTLSQFVQWRYSIYSKSLLLTSISYVQESFS